METEEGEDRVCERERERGGGPAAGERKAVVWTRNTYTCPHMFTPCPHLRMDAGDAQLL